MIKLSVHLQTKCFETILLQWRKITELQESMVTILRMTHNLEIMNGWRLDRYIRLILHFFQMTTKSHLIFPAIYQIHLDETDSNCWGLLFRWNNEWESKWLYVKSIPRFVVVWLKICWNGTIKQSIRLCDSSHRLVTLSHENNYPYAWQNVVPSLINEEMNWTSGKMIE